MDPRSIGRPRPTINIMQILDILRRGQVATERPKPSLGGARPSSLADALAALQAAQEGRTGTKGQTANPGIPQPGRKGRTFNPGTRKPDPVGDLLEALFGEEYGGTPAKPPVKTLPDGGTPGALSGPFGSLNVDPRAQQAQFNASSLATDPRAQQASFESSSLGVDPRSQQAQFGASSLATDPRAQQAQFSASSMGMDPRAQQAGFAASSLGVDPRAQQAGFAASSLGVDPRAQQAAFAAAPLGVDPRAEYALAEDQASDPSGYGMRLGGRTYDATEAGALLRDTDALTAALLSGYGYGDTPSQRAAYSPAMQNLPLLYMVTELFGQAIPNGEIEMVRNADGSINYEATYGPLLEQFSQQNAGDYANELLRSQMGSGVDPKEIMRMYFQAASSGATNTLGGIMATGQTVDDQIAIAKDILGGAAMVNGNPYMVGVLNAMIDALGIQYKASGQTDPLGFGNWLMENTFFGDLFAG